LIQKAEENDLEKAEGARGGKIIGHTKSGKAIYDSKSIGTKGQVDSEKLKNFTNKYADLTADEHEEAAKMHDAKAKEHLDKHDNETGDSKHYNASARHTEAAENHRWIASSKKEKKD